MMLDSADKKWLWSRFCHATALRRAVVALILAIASGWISIAAVKTAANSTKDLESIAFASRLVDSMTRATAPERSGTPIPAASSGYGLTLALVGLASPATRLDFRCHATGSRDCAERVLLVPLMAQLLAALATMLIIHKLALALSGEAAIAVLVLVLTIMSMRLGQFAGLTRGFIWYTLLVFLHSTFLVVAAAGQRYAAAAASGAAAVFAALFEPTALVLGGASLATLIAVPVDGLSPRRRAHLALASSVGSLVMICFLLGFSGRFSFHLDAMARHAAPQFAGRTAFNALDDRSLLDAILVPIPLLGDVVQAALSTAQVRKFAVGTVAGSLVGHASSAIYPDAIARAANHTDLAAWRLMVYEGMLSHPLAYLRAIPAVVMRGLFAGGGIVALVGLLHLPMLVRYCRANASLGLHLLLVVPVAALFAANVAFTSNEFWLNPALPFLYAYAIVYVAGGW